MSLTTKVKVAKFSLLNEKSYNKTVIDFNFGRHPYVYLIVVNKCIILRGHKLYFRKKCILSLTIDFVLANSADSDQMRIWVCTVCQNTDLGANSR